ncbi:MAG: hypothetical protein V1774_02785 [Candidatus Eisenbacteria bacterium]
MENKTNFQQGPQGYWQQQPPQGPQGPFYGTPWGYQGPWGWWNQQTTPEPKPQDESPENNEKTETNPPRYDFNQSYGQYGPQGQNAWWQYGPSNWQAPMGPWGYQSMPWNYQQTTMPWGYQNMPWNQQQTTMPWWGYQNMPWNQQQTTTPWWNQQNYMPYAQTGTDTYNRYWQYNQWMNKYGYAYGTPGYARYSHQSHQPYPYQNYQFQGYPYQNYQFQPYPYQDYSYQNYYQGYPYQNVQHHGYPHYGYPNYAYRPTPRWSSEYWPAPGYGYVDAA